MIKFYLAVLAAGVFSPHLAAQDSSIDSPGVEPPRPVFEIPVGSMDSRKTGIEFGDAWVRAMPPFQPNSAAYMTITNHRSTAIAVVSARSSVSQRTELHETREVEGLMRMQKLEGLAIAPGERAELAPGGTHLMLFNLAFRPVPGDDITLCLTLASEEEVCTSAGVRKSGDASHHEHNH